jgi:Reeler domain
VLTTKSRICHFFALGVLLASLDVKAFSSGAPVCTIDTDVMNDQMGPRIGLNPNGWVIRTQTATYSPGQATFDVYIDRLQPVPPPDPPVVYVFKGLLLWATDASGAQVGTWAIPPPGFRYVDDDEAEVVELNCYRQSITHTSSNEKNAPTLDFKLVLPITVRGEITIRAFVVQNERRRHFEMVSTHVHIDPLRNDLDIDTSVTTTRYHALTDGVLVMRYLLGLRGMALTSGVKSSAAIRTDSEIETQLASLRDLNKLDVDGNGQTRPETDGLLILRYLLGYRGARLIAGANGGTLTAPQIEAKIALLVP